MHILYIEDNPVDADLARRALADAPGQHQVEIVPCLTAARERLGNPAGLDLVLTDLRLPDGSGLEILAEIRAGRLPLAVAILTGSGDQESAALALRNGADDYIVKRRDYLLTLARQLEQVLQRHREEALRKSRPLRVLYAEHNTFDVDLTRKHLERYAPHIRLDSLNDSQRLLDRLPNAQVAGEVCDVLLLDFNLPGFNAIEVGKLLHHRGIDLPIVMVTGQGTEEVAMQAMRLGFDGYLVKQQGYLYQLPALLEGAFYRYRLSREHAALRESRQQFMELVTRIPVGVYRLRLGADDSTAFDYVSPRFREIFRIDDDTPLERLAGLFAKAQGDDLRELMAVFAKSRKDRQPFSWEGCFVLHGEQRWLHLAASVIPLADGAIAHDGIVRDITEEHAAAEKLRLAATMFDNTRDGIAITDATPRIIAVNRAFSATTGYAEQEAIGQNPAILKSGRHEAAFYQVMWHTLAEQGRWQGEIWNRRKNGEIYPEWLTISAVRDDKGEISHYVAVFTDISELRRIEEHLDRLAHYDPLSGLPNRLLFQTLLEHAIDKVARHDSRLAVLLIDLDHFKNVNDSLGHAAGDELLRKVAQRIQQRLRSEDTMARLGGDEFAVLLEALNDAQQVAVLARDILTALALPFAMDSGHQVYAGASIGIALFPDDANDATDLMRNVETAMYRAKENGRNLFSFYTSDMNADALARLDLEAALRNAIDNGELLLHYQPKVSLRSGQVVGAEALIRWQRPGNGLVSPLQFIPIAEKSDLIIAIGNWVIDCACRQIRELGELGHPALRIAVNVSARQFRSAGLEQAVSAALARYAIDPILLELELTESMLMERPEEAAAILHRLKQLGVRLSLDDFGTGYSSLAYLSRFPIDTLKIDQSFVRNILEEKTSATIATSIIGLAHRMELDVVAEGVETLGQLSYLRTHHCDIMQGYYFSKPLPAEAFRKLLANGVTLDSPRA